MQIADSLASVIDRKNRLSFQAFAVVFICAAPRSAIAGWRSMTVAQALDLQARRIRLGCVKASSRRQMAHSSLRQILCSPTYVRRGCILTKHRFSKTPTEEPHYPCKISDQSAGFRPLAHYHCMQKAALYISDPPRPVTS